MTTHKRRSLADAYNYPEPPECGTPCGALEALAHENAMLLAYVSELEAVLPPDSVTQARFKMKPADLDPEEGS